MELKSKTPSGPIEKRWDDHRFTMKLVNPANKRKYNVIVVGSGLAGASASASMATLDSKVPAGPLADKWRKHKADIKLVNPANKRKYDVIVVGSGLAGASAAATLAELGYKVKCFCFQDSSRRAPGGVW